MGLFKNQYHDQLMNEIEGHINNKQSHKTKYYEVYYDEEWCNKSGVHVNILKKLNPYFIKHFEQYNWDRKSDSNFKIDEKRNLLTCKISEWERYVVYGKSNSDNVIQIILR